MKRSLFARLKGVRGSLAIGVLAASALAGLPAALAAQQGGNIVGTVRDAENGQPLESVQVFIQGTGVGALTNAAGRFLLVNVPFGEVTVRAELVGFRAESRLVNVTPGESAVVEFTMTQTAIALEQIVVTGAGVATERKKLGNTIAAIDASQLEDAPITSFSDMIQGREPGLVGLPSSGSTGEGSRIRIRGSASLSQSNEPIIYVDGIRVDRAGGFGDNVSAGGQGSPSRLDDIPPDAIERIEVLKGAAAATLYGTEASNGVIQIFTKKGRQGTPRWTLQYDGSAIKVPTGRMLPFGDYARDADDVARIQARWNRDVQLYEPFQEDILPEFFETGWSNAVSASVSGGSDLITYFVSGRYASEDGPFGLEDLGPARDENKKYQAQANVQLFPAQNVTLRFSGLYSQVNHTTPSNSNNIFGAFSSGLMSQLRLAERPNNIYGQQAFATTQENMQEIIKQDTENFSGSANLNWQISEGFVFDGTFGVNAVNQRSSDFFPFGWNVNDFSSFFTTGSRAIDDRNHREVTADFKVSWDTQFTDRISSTLLGGTQGFINETLTSGGNGDDFPGPGLEVVGAAAEQSVFENYLKVVNAGVYVQEQLGWDDYLFVTLGARWDANSAFGEDFNTAFYPKVSVSWIPSDQLDWPYETLSTLRFRGAWGKSGLQPGAFDQLTTFGSLASVEGPGLAPDNLGNPALKPETSSEWELGAEFGFFNDSWALDLTYWDRTVTDALVARQFPVSGGFRSTQLDNIGEVVAQGLEIALNGQLVNNDTWNLSLFANASWIKEEVTNLGGAPPLKTGGSYPRYRNFIKEGEAPGAFFGAVIADMGIPLDLNGNCAEPTQAEALAYFSQPRGLGDFEVIPKNCGGDFLGTYIGKPTPDWQGSWGFNLGFLQNWELASLFEYKFGNYHVQDLSGMFRQANAVIGRNTPDAARAGATLANPASSPEERLDAAIYWANNLRALAPMAGMNGIHPADFMRWRELSLTYRFSGSLADRLRLSNGAITLGARNLALWVNDEYTGMDPEVNVLGRCDGGLDCNFLNSTEGWGIPIPRRFTFSVRLGF
jgi:TonB-linked SusC/RagA family outer membrane protein